MKKASNFGERIQKLREASKGLTQAELAKHLGVSRSTVSAWETGVNPPPPGAWLKLADFMDNLEDIIACWEAAGIKPDTLVKAAEKLAERSLIRPKEDEIVLVPPLLSIGLQDKPPLPPLPLPARYGVNPASTRYIEVDAAIRDNSFEFGDLLFIDVSETSDGRTPFPFWDQRVLVEFDRGRPSLALHPAKPCTVGRLVLIGVQQTRSDYAFLALLQPWTDEVHQPEEMHERIAFITPFEIGRWRYEVPVAERGGNSEWTFQKARERAQRELQLSPDVKILGRVIGWYRPSKQPPDWKPFV